MIRVIGFGNSLHHDDGFGPAVIAALAAGPTMPGVDVCEGGAPGFGALSLFEGFRTVLIVDAIRDGGPVGDLGWVEPQAVIATTGGSGAALHGGGLAEMLRLLPLAIGEPGPRIELLLCRIIELQPFHVGMSYKIRRAVAMAVAMIKARMLGHD